MDNSLNPILERRNVLTDHLQKGFSDGTGMTAAPGSPVAHRMMVAGRISESLEKGLDVQNEAGTHNVLTPENAGTIQEIAELMKSGQWEFFGKNNIVQYGADLRKSLDSNELSYTEWSEKLLELNKMNSTVVKGIDDEEVKVWYRPRTANDDLSKSVDYAERLEKAVKGGEGSRGGKIVGHTKSGKPIYGDKKADHYKDFTSEDHKDAFLAHNDKANAAYADKSKTEENVHHRKIANSHNLASVKTENADTSKQGISHPEYGDDLEKYSAKELIAEFGTEKAAKITAYIAKVKGGDNLQKGLTEEPGTSLEKGLIADQLGNSGENGLKFRKTGKELKELLPSVITKLEAQEVAINAQMSALITAVGCEPTDSYNSYRYESIKVMRYGWDTTEQPYDELRKSRPPLTDANKAAQKFNDLAYQLRSVMEDIAALRVIVAQVKDSDSYTLTVSQLVALAIG